MFKNNKDQWKHFESEETFKGKQNIIINKQWQNNVGYVMGKRDQTFTYHCHSTATVLFPYYLDQILLNKSVGKSVL